MFFIPLQLLKEKLRGIFIFFLLTISLSELHFSQSQGEMIFKNTCQACHSIGKGRLVGPDLLNVQDRRNESWLIKFIKSSQSVIKNGDADAVALFNEFNKTIMPDQNLSDADIKDVLNYIRQQSAGGLIADVSKPVSLSSGLTLDEARDNEFTIGRKLFSGEQKLTNGGPACISCHNVVNDELISGGLLAIDLTTAFTRLGTPGVHSVISNSPFPVMNSVYNNKSVTSDEAFYLTAFLKNADFVSSIQDPAIPQQRFLYAGIIGGAVLFALYGGIWWNRKRKSVNHSIYKRQLKSI